MQTRGQQMDDQAVSFFQTSGPFLGIISMLIGWTFFLVALSMFKEFISKGFSMAVAEFLLKSVPLDKAEKFSRWFANGGEVLTELKELKEKLKPDDV